MTAQRKSPAKHEIATAKVTLFFMWPIRGHGAALELVLDDAEDTTLPS